MKKILLAEDDFDFAGVLKQYLALSNFNVIWAKDGEEALSVFQKLQEFLKINSCNSWRKIKIK